MGAATAQINKYLNNHYEGMSPEQLILMLYKGALERITWAMEGIEENNIPKRGENLGKAIAIIAELNASIDPTMNDESTLFLKGLYKTILEELPKVSINNDIIILKRTYSYISKLKDIWENEVINGKSATRKATMPKKFPKNDYGTYSEKTTFHSFSV